MRHSRHLRHVHRPCPGALAAAALLAATAPAAAAQGRTAAVLLELPASARTAAMGDAGGAVGGVGAIAYNPALLGMMGAVSAELSVERYLGGATLGAAAGALRVGRGVLGVTVLTLRYPEAAEVVDAPDGGAGIETGARIRGHDAVAGVAWAMRINRYVNGGATVKWVGQSLPGASGGGVAADLGVAVSLPRVVGTAATLTGAVQHMGHDIELAGTAAPLPRTARLGVALEERRIGPACWSAALEATRARGGRTRPRLGLAARLPGRNLDVVARVGAASGGEAERQQPLSLGAGIARRGFALDYAWRRFGDLGATHRVGVTWWR